MAVKYQSRTARRAPILDATGNVTGAVLVFHDVTQKRRAQEALRQSHERVAWLARFPDENPSPVLRASADGSVLYCNPASLKMHGWACRVGQPLPDPLSLLVREAMAEGKEAQQDVELGGRFYFVAVTPFPGEGYANFYGRDITDRKKAEEALHQRTFELQRLTETLEQRVQQRTVDLEKANEALRHLSSKLLSVQEDERKRIAGEIHDSLGACLGGIKFKVEDALQKIGETSKDAAESLKTAIPVIQEGVEECRRIQMDLRPPMLDDLGLLPTLSWFCRRFQTIYSGIRVNQEVTVREDEVPESLKIVAFRVTQEAMNNIAKHSKADRVCLCLGKIDDRMELMLEDNGRGFDLEKVLGSGSARRGLGLSNMRERTELSGGSFWIESTEGKGTTIRAWWPL
jgi:signal transduction histidine kinase